VVRGTGGAVANQWVVIHRVLADQGGPLDSICTDAGGRYRFRVRPDTGALYLTSTLYRGIGYFSEALDLRGRVRDTVPDLLVYDTSSTGAPIRLVRRLITIARPKPDGARDALEILELQNPGPATRVTDDTTRPVWSGRIPRQAIQFQVGQGDLSPAAISLRGDSILVTGALAPGPTKQVSVGYVLPGDLSRVVFRADQATAELDFLLEDTTAKVIGAAAAMGVQPIEQRSFARYRAQQLRPGDSVIIEFPGGPFRVQSLLPYVIVLLIVIFAAAFFVALRRAPPPTSAR